MSKSNKVIGPVLEESIKFKGVKHVNVDKTVQEVRKQLAENQKVELVARQSEISRIGMIMKRVEEDCKAKILTMKTDYQTFKENDREINALLFKVVFQRP